MPSFRELRLPGLSLTLQITELSEHPASATDAASASRAEAETRAQGEDGTVQDHEKEGINQLRAFSPGQLPL